MWPILNGTIVNSFTVLLGSVVGVMLGARLPQRYQQIVLNGLGLVTICLGIDAGVLRFADTVSKFGPQVSDGQTYGARVAMVMIGSLLIGAIIGTALKIHERIEATGGWIHRRFGGGSADADGASPDGAGFAAGFLTASVIFCVGPLTLVGCLENGAHANPSFLYIKALLDGFCS
ncbi:MAG: DUF554 family protein, partial [Phycisphaerae bacterium]